MNDEFRWPDPADKARLVTRKINTRLLYDDKWEPEELALVVFLFLAAGVIVAYALLS